MNAKHYLRVVSIDDTFYCRPLDTTLTASKCVGDQVRARDLDTDSKCRRCIYGLHVARTVGIEFAVADSNGDVSHGETWREIL